MNWFEDGISVTITIETTKRWSEELDCYGDEVKMIKPMDINPKWLTSVQNDHYMKGSNDAPALWLPLEYSRDKGKDQ